MQVKFCGKNLLEILDFTVIQAKELFFSYPKITLVLEQVVEIGLGYMTLGQHLSSFSGGEAQRLKLLDILISERNKQPGILLIDEPTTGLADKDVKKLLDIFVKLTAKNYTVIIVEHHVGMLQSCDWLIEIGPESGDKGGELIFEGPVKNIKNCELSKTRKYLDFFA